MKKIRMVSALLVSALILGSCAKDSSEKLEGSYTYKTSGSVTLMAKSLVGLDPATLSAYKAAGVNVDPVLVGLYPEQGQMHIVGCNDKFKITFNDILGNADVTDATVDRTSITIEGNPTKAAQLTDGKDKIGAGMVLYTGSGTKYDDMLIMDLQYQGEFSVNGVQMVVVASDVHCVAQSNE